jgi:hypothetical protein
LLVNVIKMISFSHILDNLVGKPFPYFTLMSDIPCNMLVV